MGFALRLRPDRDGRAPLRGNLRGEGIQCNTANLIVNHGWSGLLFDGDERQLEKGRAYYARLGDTFAYPPKLVSAWITRDNINDLIKNNGFEGDVDLLSLDLDGVDYWVWDALEVIRPRVVIAEIQCLWGEDRAVTVPYADEFRAGVVDRFAIYSGASLPAFVKLAQERLSPGRCAAPGIQRCVHCRRGWRRAAAGSGSPFVRGPSVRRVGDARVAAEGGGPRVGRGLARPDRDHRADEVVP